MSIAEKALQLKQDFDDVHEAGKQKVISQSKYIEKTVTGKVISLTDVSEVYHKVKVYGDNCAVKVYGKNLLPYPYRNTSAVTVSGVTITPNEDGSIHVKGTSTATCALRLLDSVDLKDGITYKICDNSNNWAVYLAYTDEYGSQRTPGGNGTVNVNPFTWKDGYKQIGVYIQMLAGNTVDETIYPMLSFADSDLSWESYKEPQTITATPTGTEIESMCPNMTFMADSDITVDYYSSFGMNEGSRRTFSVFQQNGARLRYDYACYGDNFTDETFKPIFDFHPTAIPQMFYSSRIQDLLGILERQRVVFDTSNCTTLNHAFTSSKITRLPVIDASKGTTNSLFYGATNLWYIEGIISSENTVWHNEAFGKLSALTHVIFSGAIANDISVKDSPLLDDESVKSLALTLKWYNAGEDGYMTKTVVLHPNVWARAAQINVFDSDEIFVSVIDYIDGKGWKRA